MGVPSIRAATIFTRAMAMPRRPPVTLQGRWLLLARIGWLVFVAVAIAHWIVTNFWIDMSSSPLPGASSLETVREGLTRLHFPPDMITWLNPAVMLVTGAVYFAAAALLFWRKSNETIALLLGLFLVVQTTATYPPALLTMAETHPILAMIGTVTTATFALLFYWIVLLFPDGRFTPRWTVIPAMIWLVSLVDGFFLGDHLPSASGGWLEAVFAALLLGCAAYSQVYRYRRSGPAEREQIKWGGLDLGIALSSFAIMNVFLDWARLDRPGTPPEHAALATLTFDLIGTLTSLLIPLTLGIAIFRYRLFAIDIVINRALVYVTLTACVIGIYALTVSSISSLFRIGNNTIISLAATGLIAILFQPLRERLQRGVNRMFYGDRDDPYAALSRLGQRLEGTLAPDAVLPAIVTTVTETLNVPYAAITLSDTGTIAAESGTPAGTSLRLPLIYQGEPAGELLVAPRAADESFSSADRRLLDDLARQVGVAVHAVQLYARTVQLATDLQHSRERLITAREEERRRLRRDLHDGLGPQLASLTLKLETARNRLAADPVADALLADLTAQTQAAITDIRRLVYALRPPALDELGLVFALRESAAQYSGDARLCIAVEAPAHLPPLPAAVEVAAFRIAQEAMTNVARHAMAGNATLRLALDDAAGVLCLELQDDGRGLAPDHRIGVGLASMRERSEELGGTWTIEPVPTGGTRVIAQLPYRLPGMPESKHPGPALNHSEAS